MHLPQIRNSCEWNTTNVFEGHCRGELCTEGGLFFVYVACYGLTERLEGTGVTTPVYITGWLMQMKGFCALSHSAYVITTGADFTKSKSS